MPSALVLFLAHALSSAASATEVLSVSEKKIEIRVTDDFPLSSDQLYYVLDNGNVRRGIVKIESVIEDVAFGELLMGSAEPQMKLELRGRKTARRGHAGGRSPASVDESTDGSGDDRSEYWWTPKPGSFSLEARLAMASGSYTIPVSGQSLSASQSISNVGTSVIYSFNPRFSLGLAWNIVNSDRAKIDSYSFARSGPADPQLTALYQNKDGDAVYYFGLAVNVGLGAKKLAGLDEAGNYSSGGIGVTPILGLLVHASEHYFGARLHYQYLLPATAQTSGGATYQLTGGNTVGMEMYYEYHVDDWVVSPIFGFDSHDAASSTSNSGSSSGTDPYTVPHWKLKGAYAFTPHLRGSLAVISQQILVDAGDTPVHPNAFGGELGLRYEF